MVIESDGFECVHTMTDYWDGPREGIANLRGAPHAYRSPFNESIDDYEHWFELRPIDEATFALALEDWAIWLRWEEAYHAGLADLSTHPALPADRSRHDELASILAARLAALPDPPIRARGVFRPMPGHENAGRGRWLEVRWDIVSPEHYVPV